MIVKTFETIEKEYTDEEIYDQRLFNVCVLGLPRSGTSMMSGIIERLGVNWLSNTDTAEEKEKREKIEKIRFGETYIMNENFYEIASDSYEFGMRFACEKYVGKKVILPIRQGTLAEFKYNPIRVIQMFRDPEEIRQSQQASYRTNTIQTEEEAAIEVAKYQGILVDTVELLNDLNIPNLTFQYRDVLKNPREKIKKIAEFINAPNSIDEAVAWVDPDRNRFKKEELQEAI